MHRDITPSKQSLSQISEDILHRALSASSTVSYQKTLKFYQQYLNVYFPTQPVLPVKLEHIMLFLAYCSYKGLAYSTITTYVSILNYVHKLSGFEEIAGNFVIKKMLQGLKKSTAKSDLRLPITHSILKALVTSLEHLNFSYFLKSLLKAMYLIAFHAFLRIGEITQSGNPANNITWQAVQFLLDDKAVPYAIELNMATFKHNSGKSCHKLHIQQNNQQMEYCPVQALWKYCKLRGNAKGPLFCFLNGNPISRYFFSQKLKLSLQFVGCNTDMYKGHSFRIGAATHAASKGYSDQDIQIMGRWHSDAFKKYIRIPVMQI